MITYNQIVEAKNFIESKVEGNPKVAVILGSGLGSFVSELSDVVSIPYKDIPYFPQSMAVGHGNELIIGKYKEKTIIVMKGRFHYYEGISLDLVTLPIRVLKLLGIDTLVITNSCGAINTKFKPGQLMLITDHINLTGVNPLIGPNLDEFGPRFPDMSNVYNEKLNEEIIKEAKNENIYLKKGVYAWWTGPVYETPAEIRMIRNMGADAVGMSTVPEAIVAKHSGMEVIGLSCLTNMACGILETPLSHDEVIKTAKESEEPFKNLVKIVINKAG